MKPGNIEIVFIAYNRLGYTKLAMEGLLSDPKEEFSLVIWDNGSKDGTREYLESIQDPRIARKVLSEKNVYLTGAANECFAKSQAELVGIIPDDFLVTPGWTRPLAEAHAEVPELGFVGCWHLGRDCFEERRAGHKIQAFGRHRILRHPYTGGGAGLIKLKAWKECGPFEGIMTPACWIRMALRGYVNGFYIPPIFVEHMDYPWSKFYVDKGDPISEIRKRRGIHSLEELKHRHRQTIRNVLDGPWDARQYVGWRNKLRRLRARWRSFVGIEQPER